MNSKMLVELDSNIIEVTVGPGVFANLYLLLGEVAKSSHYYLLVDSKVFDKYMHHFEELLLKPDVNHFLIKGEKKNKTFATAMSVFADLDRKNISRDVAIVAIGGGVVGDLAGFVASCWYRGVELIHVPTTLLSAVDSCLGGKTALNFRQTVNAVGSYHQPSAILIDSKVLIELPIREISSGFGEIIKYAALGSEQILGALESDLELTPAVLSNLVVWSLEEKAKFVAGDIQESNQRLYLNFGHTVGHAIEFSTNFNGTEVFRHGEGVALGMLAAFRICAVLGYLEEADVSRLRRLIQRYGLPTEVKSAELSQTRESLVDLVVGSVYKDKKRTNSGLRLVVLDGWGTPLLHHTSDERLIRIGVEEVVK